MSQFSRQELNFMGKVFKEYSNIYTNIFKHLYPAKNSTGFPERNLSVNFSKAYEKVATTKNQNAISWFEFQFGKKNDLHLDAIVMNTSSNELILVESKRFNSGKKKIRQVGEDIDRIYSCIKELKKASQNSRIDLKNKYKKVYGVVLADVWPETRLKKSILNAFQTKCFLTNFSTIINSTNKISGEKYYNCTFNLNNFPYHLVSFMWKIQ